jgi:hypothetical protein
MKKAFFLAVAMTVLSACNSYQMTPEEKAQEAAVAYYNSLLAGEYEAFLNGRATMDSIPDNYRERLLNIYKQFMLRQQEEHGGIAGIEATHAATDSTLNVMQVFLNLNFNDSTKEEIVVPMVEKDGEWKMK